MLDAAFDQAKTFFAQPMEKKMEVDHKLGDSFKGYVRELRARMILCCRTTGNARASALGRLNSEADARPLRLQP